jgi:hypothetical protein
VDPFPISKTLSETPALRKKKGRACSFQHRWPFFVEVRIRRYTVKGGNTAVSWTPLFRYLSFFSRSETWGTDALTSLASRTCPCGRRFCSYPTWQFPRRCRFLDLEYLTIAVDACNSFLCHVVALRPEGLLLEYCTVCFFLDVLPAASSLKTRRQF